jgi:nitrogen fixation/metabolism regulation signal transduction histidine kinase
MNSKKMVKLSNTIGFISVLALIYWIIIFITLQVFELKVFKENTTSTFYFSIMGILALMFGALMINIMFNLSRIAERDKNEDVPANRNKKGIIAFLASIPLIICFLFLGNFISAKSMENNLKKSADEIINTYYSEIKAISDYSFTKEWINNTAKMIRIMQRIDQNFDNVSLILSDEINGNKMYLTFSGTDVSMDDKYTIDKVNYINKSTLKEREYLEKVLTKDYNEKYFVSENRYYSLFVPWEEDGKKIIFLFTNRRHYGTLSS